MRRSYGFYAGRFALSYLAAIAALVALRLVLRPIAPGIADTLAGLPGIVIALIPTIFCAQAFWKAEGRRETRSEGWTLAAIFTGCVLIISAVQFALLVAAVPESGAVLGRLDAVVLIGGSLFIAALYFVGMRFLFWSLVRGHARAAARGA